MEKKTHQSKDDLLKSIEEVLDQALKEYEELSKMDDFEFAEDPSRPIAAAPAEAAPEMEAAPSEEAEEEDEEEKKKKKDEEEEGEEQPEEESPDMSDETLKSEFATLKSQMEARGLLQKTEVKAEEMKKSEIAIEVESLKKSHNDQIEALNKTIAALSEKIEKIASAPQPRKGVSGLTPLKKSEGEGQPLNKTEVLNKLMDLKKSGKNVDTALITRIETNRASEQDFARIKALIG